ncbi:MAG: hypothetical protein NXI32_26960 [bacterium]|nr:hypothetical protein [bacterium]
MTPQRDEHGRAQGLTVGQLIELLQHFDQDSKVWFNRMNTDCETLAYAVVGGFIQDTGAGPEVQLWTMPEFELQSNDDMPDDGVDFEPEEWQLAIAERQLSV